MSDDDDPTMVDPFANIARTAQLVYGGRPTEDATDPIATLSVGGSGQNAVEPTSGVGPGQIYILNTLLAEVADRMIKSAGQYGPNNHHVLGPAGQFADIWRKIGPLKRAMWEGRELPREGVEEVLFDLIGHCLLSLEMYRNGTPRGGDWVGVR